MYMADSPFAALSEKGISLKGPKVLKMTGVTAEKLEIAMDDTAGNLETEHFFKKKNIPSYC